MVTVTIDGKKVEAPEGATILQAARSAGIDTIPTLCYDERLSPYGSCRLCLVEIVGAPKWATACSTPVQDGMEVLTRTPDIERARRALLELLLVHHPLDCPTCDSAGECSLQDLTFEYQQFETRFEAPKHSREIDVTSPIVIRDPNKCVYCGRCVRVCGELQGVHAIDYINRGFSSYIAPPFGESLDCEFCGQCIAVCPVGALTSKPFRFKARPWELTTVTSTCGYCSTGCTVEIDVKESSGDVVRVKAAAKEGMNDTNLCGKGRFGFERVNHVDRLDKPLKKSDGRLKEGEWSDVIRSLVFDLKAVIDKHGASAVGGLGSNRTTNEANYLFQKFFRADIGSDNLDTIGGVTYLPGRQVLNEMLGLGNAFGSFEDLKNADFILVVDSDVTDTNPVFSLPILQAARFEENKKVVVANSRVSKLTRYANKWVRIRPGEGASFLAALIKAITDKGLEKPVADAMDIKQLGNSMEKRSVESLASRAGADVDSIKEIASDFAAAENGVIVISTSSSDLSKGEEVAKAAGNIVLLTGGGKGRVFFLPETNNLQGACDFGVRAGMLPGWERLADEEAKKHLEELWKVNLPVREGLDLEGMISAAEKGELKALIVMGANPFLSLPDSVRVRNAFRNLELLVVIDQFMTETAQTANYVLPALGWAETDGSFTNFEGRIQRVRRAHVKERNALSDVKILERLDRAMGNHFQHKGLQDLWMEMASAAPVMEKALKDLPVYEKKGSRWPDDVAVDQDKQFRFLYLDQDSSEEKEDFRFKLVTGNLLNHSGTMTRFCDALLEVVDKTQALLTRKDARDLGVSDGDFVRIEAHGKGSVELPVKISKRVFEGTVFVPVHFGDVVVHQLTTWPAAGRSPYTMVKISPSRKG